MFVKSGSDTEPFLLRLLSSISAACCRCLLNTLPPTKPEKREKLKELQKVIIKKIVTLNAWFLTSKCIRLNTKSMWKQGSNMSPSVWTLNIFTACATKIYFQLHFTIYWKQNIKNIFNLTSIPMFKSTLLNVGFGSLCLISSDFWFVEFMI